MVATTVRSRLARFGVASVLVGAAVLGGAAPAQAAPGEAHARPVSTNLAITPADTGTAGTIITQLGVTSAPPDATASIPATTIQADLGPTMGGVSDVLFFESLASASSSNGSGTAASASVGSMTMNTPGGPLVISEVSSSVTCPRGGGVSSTTTGPAGVKLDGVPIALDGSGTTVIDLSSGLGTFIITLTAGTTSLDSASARATGLVVQITEDLTGLISASGTVILADVECGSHPVRATSGTIRVAETGAPLSDVCIVWSPVSNPGQNSVQWSNGNGTFTFDTDEPGPLNIGFFVPQSSYDCNSSISLSRIPSWLDGQPLTGATWLDAVAPLGGQHVAPGTTGIVACLGTSGPVATADCVEPDVTLSGRVVGATGSPVKACVFVLGPSGDAVGPIVTEPDGSWSASGLPKSTHFAVAFLPYFDGMYGPCADDGPPQAPPAGQLQPAFLGNVWIDFTDMTLFENPQAWGVARGATLLSGSKSGILGCLTTAPGNQAPRAECLNTLAITGTDPLPVVPIGLGLTALGFTLFLVSRRRVAATR